MEEIVLGPAIGRGSFGKVYEAIYHGTHVAAKLLHVDLSSDSADKLAEDFAEECKLMRELRHPNVVLFMGSCISDRRLCMIIELMTRGSVFFLYHNKKRPPKDHHLSLLCRISQDSCRGMAYLHTRTPPLVHRDLKSPNILIDENWTSKISDFGMTRFRDESRTMTRCGSPLWAAPEVLRGDRFNERCDLYSMSIVLWELAHWEEPYQNMRAMEVIRSVAKMGYRPPIAEEVPDLIKSLINEMWEDKAEVGDRIMRSALASK